MPYLSSITAARYRSYALPTEVEIRPLTLLYGKNSAGKSALLRLLPILANSVAAGAGSPLVLLDKKSAFSDVLWKGPPSPRDLTLGLGFADSGVTRASFTLRYSEDRRQTLVEELRVTGAGSADLVARRIPEERENERKGAPLVYSVSGPGLTGEPGPWTFQGLVPMTHPVLPDVAELRRNLVALRDSVQWIQALRVAPERRNPERGSEVTSLGQDGADACHALRTDDELLQEVSAWYRENTGRLVELRDAPPGDFRVLLRPLDTPAMDVDLVDSGEGFIQLFPVLTALAMARRRARNGQHILAVEEPESHLHPDRQIALAQVFAKAAAEDAPPAIVLETHSFPLILAVQLEIARGNLPAERVVAYWIEQLDDRSSIASRVTFDPLGHPEGPWPSGAFADQRRLALELQRAQSAGSQRR
jgi:predicted ATPase